MKLSAGQSCLLLIVGAFFITAFESAAQNPTMLVVLILLCVGFIVAIFAFRSRKQKIYLSQMEQMADTLDGLANGNFPTEQIVFATQDKEEVILRLGSVALKEFRSDGSSFAGGYGGVSFRVAKGIRANVGGMKGSSQRNPEVSTVLDLGEVTFTNQRIVFAGDNMVREFDLDKVVNMEVGPNGVTLEISVSNRQKTSILEAANFPDITPGIAADIALGWQRGGKKAAMKEAKESADRIRAMIASENAKASKG